MPLVAYTLLVPVSFCPDATNLVCDRDDPNSSHVTLQLHLPAGWLDVREMEARGEIVPYRDMETKAPYPDLHPA